GTYRNTVVDAKRVTLRVPNIRSHAACSIGRDVMHRRGLRGRGRHYDGVIHRAIVAQNLYHLRNRRALLANGAINTNEIVAFVVDNSIESDGSFSGLPIANDQLALAAADGNHAVDGLQSSCHRFADWLPVNNARRQTFQGNEFAG